MPDEVYMHWLNFGSAPCQQCVSGGLVLWPTEMSSAATAVTLEAAIHTRQDTPMHCICVKDVAHALGRSSMPAHNHRRLARLNVAKMCRNLPNQAHSEEQRLAFAPAPCVIAPSEPVFH